jgi:transposase-like protein
MRKSEVFKNALVAISDGESIASFASRSGVHKSTIHRWVNNGGPRNDSREYSEEIKNEAVRLYLSGIATKPISKIIGCTDQTVARWVESSGHPLRNKSEAAALVRETWRGRVKGQKIPFWSAKNSNWLISDSSYEYARMIQLDSDASVSAFSKCSRSLFYANGRRRYLPDFIVEYFDGRKFIEEVKPSVFLNDKKVVEKSLVAIEWCKRNGYEFRFVTECDIGDKYLEIARSDAVPSLISSGAKARRAEYRHRHYVERIKGDPVKIEEHRARARAYYHRKKTSEQDNPAVG